MAVKRPKPAVSAEAAALRLLGRRDCSRAEVRRKLEEKGFPPEEADGVLQKFGDRGLLDDSRLARNLIRSCSSGKLWGPRRIMQKLLQRGIPADLAKELIDREEDPGSIQERLRRLIARRIKTQGLDSLPLGEKKRLAGALRQRGYSWEEISEALRNAGGWFEE